MYSSTLSLPSALGGVGGQRHTPAALSWGVTLCPLYRAGMEGCGKSRPPAGIRSQGRPARTESLYRLQYSDGPDPK